MFEFLARLFDTTGFVPRKNCGEWTDALMWMHIGGDLFIWLAYLSIPLVLLYFTRRRDLPYPWLFVLFAVFIVACGFGHLIEALMFDRPLYRLAGVWKVFTAIVSWVTVLSLIPVIPRVMHAVAQSTGSAPPSSATPPGGFGNTTLHRLAAPTRRDRVSDYTIALLAGVLALLIRAAIDEIVETDHVYVLSLMAVVFVSWQSGFGPGIVTLLVSMIGMVFFFVSPRGSLVINGFGNQLATAMFFFCGVCCAGLGEAQWVARRNAKRALAAALEQKDELASEVARRQFAEAGLRTSEATLRAFYNNSPVCMGIVELLADDIRHVYDNAASCEFYGVGPGETAGRRSSELGTPPPVLSLWHETYAQSAAADAAVPFEYEYDSPEGRRWLRATVSPLDEAEGRRLFCYVSEDVTSRRRAEEAVRESEARFRSMADSAPALIWLAERDEKRTYFNRGWLAFTGRPVERELGEGWAENVHPDDHGRYLEAYSSAFAAREGFEIEYRLRRHDGAYRWMLARGTPRFTPSGGFAGFIGLCLDVTDRRDAERAVRESEERFRTLTEAIPQIVWNADASGGVTYVNRRWVDYTGASREHSRGAGWLDAVHPDDRDRVAAAWAETTSGTAGPTNRFTHELRLRQRDGEYRWFLTVAVPLQGSAGGLDQWIGSMADVHDQKTAARLVEDANHFLEATINALPSHIAVLDETGCILKVNEAWRRFGDENDLQMAEHGVGSNYLDACDVACSTHPEMSLSDGIRAVISSTAANYRTEYPCHSPTDKRWFQMRVTRFPGEGAVRVVVAHENITDRVLAEEAVRESEEKFRTMADSIPQLAWMAEADGSLFWYNQRWYDYTGTTFDQMKGWGWQSVHDPAELPRVVEKFKRYIAGGEVWEDTFPLRRYDGAMRWHLSRARPIRDRLGNIVRWFGTNTDVTEQRELEHALRDAAEKFRTLTEAMPQFVWTCRPDGRCDYLSRQWVEYTGVPEADQLGVKWLEQVHPDDRAALAEHWRATVEGEANLDVEFRIRRRDGAFRWFKTRAVPFRDAGGAVLKWVGTNTDIDDTKQAEAGLRAAMERFRTLTEAVPQMVWTADPKGEVNFFNRRWDEYTGVPLTVGRAGDFGDVVHPDDVEQLRAEWQLATAHQVDRFAQEFRLRRASDGAYRWMLSTAVSLRDPGGNVAEWVGSITDIDDQKRYAETLEQTVQERTGALVAEVEERKRAEHQVRAVAAELSRSNSELEQFAYVASHDLQEPLRKIQAFGDRLVNRVRAELPEAGKEYVDRMLTSAGRMRRLIDDLLSFSRVTTQAKPFARVDLGKVAREVVSDLSERIEPVGGEVRVRDLPVIDADPTQMRQLFQNLIANAVKFQRRDVPPVVEITAEILPAGSGADGAPSPVCRLTIRDNGIGFDEKYKDRIFQVFQRLHGREEYEGTGVGLAICRKITERHGGSITARSRVGEGTAFIITLPIHHSQATDPPSDD